MAAALLGAPVELDDETRGALPGNLASGRAVPTAPDRAACQKAADKALWGGTLAAAVGVTWVVLPLARPLVRRRWPHDLDDMTTAGR
jgi:hypothetical protein